MKHTARLVATGVLLAAWSVGSYVVNRTATLLSGEVAVKQFDNSDTSFLVSNVGMHYLTGSELPITAAVLILLIVVWLKPISDLFRGDDYV